MNTRNQGIDLFRVISMLMVVAIHITGATSALNSGESINYHLVWLIHIACYGAVNCYALISGYVGVSAKYKYTNIICLWLQVIVLNVGLRIIQCFLDPSCFTLGVALTSFLPVFERTYWYFTDYFILFFFIPILNSAVHNLSKALLKNALIIAGILFSGSLLFPLPALAANPFNLQDGYSFVWLMYLYLVGAYIAVYTPFANTKKRIFLLAYLLCIVITWGTKFILGKAPNAVKEYVPSTFLVSYISPTILIGAIALLLLFSKLPIIPQNLNKIVKVTSPLCFGIYIVHLHPVIWGNIKPYLSYIGIQPVWLFIILLLSAVFGLFLLSGFIEMIRLYAFKWLRLKEKLLHIEYKYINEPDN